MKDQGAVFSSEDMNWYRRLKGTWIRITCEKYTGEEFDEVEQKARIL